MSEQEPVLVVGATGWLGGQVVDRLLARGKKVRALVRPASDAGKLEAKGVEIARGDMLDLDSLVVAMTGTAAVISTAAGYTGKNKNADEIDTRGNANLAIAASKAGVPRFVLTSILTSDQTPGVPHFWHKKLTEDKLEELGVPFVALRPGAFFDQIARLGGDPFEKGRIIWLGSKNVPLTFILTSDLARYLAEAVDADIADGERIDLGWTRPISMREGAELASRLADKKIRVLSLPTGLLLRIGKISGKSGSRMWDMGAMAAWFETGRYVANTSRQTEVFGPAPTPEDAVARFAVGLGH
ncbi:SDR family oxidoreductase [Arthrobacter sp. NPDC056886]|uniref:SDR family oxidoreductase n=1 Tax=Arthrobacter sp. NPDC056886 TaxID=3345960 RepID=UPI00366C0B1E